MAIKRQQIIGAMETRFQGILVSGGYNSDLGSNVIVSRPQLINPDGSVGRAPVEPSECPCLLVRDPLDTVVVIDLEGTEEHLLDVEWEIRHEGGSVTDADLRKMEADVRKAAGTDTTWGGLCHKETLYKSSEKILLQADRIIGAVLIRAQLFYLTAAFAEE